MKQNAKIRNKVTVEDRGDGFIFWGEAKVVV